MDFEKSKKGLADIYE